LKRVFFFEFLIACHPEEREPCECCISIGFKRSKTEIKSKRQMRGRNIFENIISEPEFRFISDSHPLYIYEHRRSGLPMACVAGFHQTEVVGGVFYFRAIDDSMNMEIEAPLETTALVKGFLSETIGSTHIPEDGVDGICKRFFANLYQHLQTKTYLTKDGRRITPKEMDAQSSASNVLSQDEEKEEKDEHLKEPFEESREEPMKEPVDEPSECMICLESPPNTTVIPCFHSVVCSTCSASLENSTDSKICCQCRCPITGVYYPDDSVKVIE
jgi:hypothetical protein